MTIAIYDGQCVLCNQTRRIVNALDWLHRVEFLDLHDPQTLGVRYPQVPYDQAMGQMHVVTGSGQLMGGFFGVRRLLRDLPLGVPLWALLHLPGMTWVGQRAYRWIARHRYAINRFFGVELDPCADGVCKIPS